MHSLSEWLLLGQRACGKHWFPGMRQMEDIMKAKEPAWLECFGGDPLQP